MIQFNLLPDVKMEYIKARSNKRMVIFIALATAAAALFILILLFLVVDVLQKKHLSDLNKDISKYSQQLKDTKDLDKILTIQNQLNSLTSLHDKKPVASRLSGYLSQITPAKVSISDLQVDFDASTIKLAGSADSLATVNQFVDTLKFTNYDTDTDKGKPAFKNVVLAAFTPPSDGKASYNITLSFDSLIFSSASNVKLVVPSQVTTRSEVEKPNSLFDTAPATTTPTGGH